jgi:transcriptional regulator, AraC family
MLQEYEIPEEVRRFHTELPVLSYGHFRGKAIGCGKYWDLEVCIRLGDENEYGVDYINGKEYRTPFPHVVLKSPGLAHSFRSVGEREVCFFHYPAESVMVLERYGMDFSLPIWPIVYSGNIERLFAEAENYVSSLHTAGVPERIDAIFLRIMVELFLCRENVARKPDFNEKKIREAASYLHSHCAEKIDMPRLIASCGMSRRAFYLHWRRFYSQSPAQFVLAQRIQQAKFLLKNTDHSVSRIAEELSFCNSIYFIRAFRKSTGETPLMYRKKRVTVREIR